jgi:NAD-dependent SIR2 family protein deacetylase
MDSIAILSHANWKLNMKRRELIKPDLNPPYTRLCKEEIKPSAKLFGEELPKHLKPRKLANNCKNRPLQGHLVRIITVLKVTSRRLCAPNLMIAPAIHSLPDVLF